MEADGQRKDYAKYFLALVALLGLLLIKNLNHWQSIFFFAILCLTIVISLLTANGVIPELSFASYSSKLVKPVPQQYSDQDLKNYTKIDLENLKLKQKESSKLKQTDAYQRGFPSSSNNMSPILIDNSRRMKDFVKFTSYNEDKELEEPVLRKELSFGTPDIEKSEVKVKKSTKEVKFEVGSKIQESQNDQNNKTSFTDKDFSYRKERIEELAEFIHTGIMNQDRFFKEYKVEYVEPRRQAVISPTVTTIPKAPIEKPVVPSGLLDIKKKQENDNLLLNPSIRKDILQPPSNEKPKISLFKQGAANLSTITEVQEDSLQEKSKIPAEAPTQFDAKTIPSKPVQSIFDSMVIEPTGVNKIKPEEPIASSSKGVLNPGISALFGHTTSFTSNEKTPEPKRPVQAPVGRQSGVLEFKDHADTMAKNKDLYYSMSAHCKDVMKNPNKISEAKATAIKETVRNFLRDICSSIDDHFLGECEKIIYELNQQKFNEDEYLVFIYELVTQFILEFMGLMSSNKIKIIYAGVIFQILSIYHCSIIELIQAIAFRKFPWLRGEKITPTGDLEEYLQKIGFDNFEKTVKPKGKTDKDHQEYIKAIAEKIGTKTRKSEGAKPESKFDQFYNRLDFYSLVLFSTLSCDLKVQLRGVNSQLAQKYLNDYTLSYEQMYFEMLDKIIKATPIQFRALILRNWVNVSSDIWATQPNNMLQIIRHMATNSMKQIEDQVIAPSAEFFVFGSKSVVQELRNTAIGLREDLKFIIEEKSIKSKDKIFDPDR